METIEILNLTRAEAANLENNLGKESVNIQTRTYKENEFGAIDPISVIVVVSKLAIAGIALWMKNNRKKKIVIERKKVLTDGSTISETTTIEIPTGTSEKDIEGKILEQLSNETDSLG